MSYHTPPGWRDRCMFVGDGGYHEILITGGGALAVRCQCSPGRVLRFIRTAEQALKIHREHKLAAERAS